jgi:hypothetical protein
MARKGTPMRVLREEQKEQRLKHTVPFVPPSRGTCGNVPFVPFVLGEAQGEKVPFVPFVPFVPVSANCTRLETET